MADGEDEVSSSTDHVSCGIVLRDPADHSDDLGVSVSKYKAVSPDEGIGDLVMSSVPPSLANPTLQSLLSSPVSLPGSQLLAGTDGIQIIAVSAPNDILGQADSSGRVWHVDPPEIATIISVAADGTIELERKHEMAVTGVDMDDAIGGGSSEVSSVASHDSILMPPPPQPLPADCPTWAHRIRCCEKIGDSYRGYVDSEVDLDLLLTYHKQHTQSFWGTRQSPSPAKPSTRLMWKSQYVPFDGIPFVNSGSRAIVMECQYGPRRKGSTLKKHMMEQCGASKQCEQFVPGDYRQTCPARIYIKKVKKFPQYAVDMTIDKKTLKLSMDKAFHELKQRGFDDIGQERYYIQLPTDKAHEFHVDSSISPVQSPAQTPPISVSMPFENLDLPESSIQRLDPRVAQKIREVVSGGETRVYVVRKILRCFVVRHLCNGGEIPERHDLTLFPTVNDLKNHIHQALKDIENGSLALTAPTVNVEIISSNDGAQGGDMGQLDQSLWQQTNPDGGDNSEPVPETVTVTLTQNPGEDGHVISRIETHLSDGSTRVSTTLTPETAQLLSRLHPNMFPANLLMQQQVDQAVTSIADPSVPPCNNIKVEDSGALGGVEHMDPSVVSVVGDSMMTSNDPHDIDSIHIVPGGLGVVATSQGDVCTVVAGAQLEHMESQLGIATSQGDVCAVLAGAQLEHMESHVGVATSQGNVCTVGVGTQLEHMESQLGIATSQGDVCAVLAGAQLEHMESHVGIATSQGNVPVCSVMSDGHMGVTTSQGNVCTFVAGTHVQLEEMESHLGLTTSQGDMSTAVSGAQLEHMDSQLGVATSHGQVPVCTVVSGAQLEHMESHLGVSTSQGEVSVPVCTVVSAAQLEQMEQQLGVSTSSGGVPVCTVVSAAQLDHLEAHLGEAGTAMAMEEDEESSLDQDVQHAQFVTVTMNESGEIIPMLDVDEPDINSLH